MLIYCKLKTNFITRSQLLYMGCPLTREREQKKKPIFIFRSEFDREVKREFEKASVSRAVRLRECPLTES